MKRLLLLAILLAGCGEEFTHLRFDRLTHPPDPASTSRRRVTIHEGNAIAVKAVAMDDDDPMEDLPRIELWPCDPAVVGVAPAREDRSWDEALHDEDDDDPAAKAPAFVIWGAGTGRSCLEVVVDGRDRESIAVDVVGGP